MMYTSAGTEPSGSTSQLQRGNSIVNQKKLAAVASLSVQLD
ncbi:hypothetical protein [Paenibacillus sp. NPDC057934]